MALSHFSRLITRKDREIAVSLVDVSLVIYKIIKTWLHLKVKNQLSLKSFHHYFLDIRTVCMLACQLKKPFLLP